MASSPYPDLQADTANIANNGPTLDLCAKMETGTAYVINQDDCSEVQMEGKRKREVLMLASIFEAMVQFRLTWNRL